MKIFTPFLLLFIFFLSSCKREECVIIEDKYISNGFYYFYFIDNSISDPISPNNSFLEVSPLGSGKVSKEDYENYKVGEEYCY